MNDAANWNRNERELAGCGDYLPPWLKQCDCGAVTYDKDEPCPCPCMDNVETTEGSVQ